MIFISHVQIASATSVHKWISEYQCLIVRMNNIKFYLWQLNVQRLIIMFCINVYNMLNSWLNCIINIITGS